MGGTQDLQALRQQAAQDPQAVVREAARQFEAMFMEQLLKSMRDSAQASGMLDNEGSQLGTEMLDQQWAARLAGRPGGLADVIARQMSQQLGLPDASGTPVTLQPLERPARGAAAVAPAANLPAGAAQAASAASAAGVAGTGSTASGATVEASPAVPGTPAAFLQQHQAAAEAVEAASGIPAEFMLAQAAHETGWGRHPIRNADGSPSHNLFGIKAGAGWNGPTTDILTTEVIDGQVRKVVQRFRAYASPAESFADYARLLKTSPRYAEATRQAVQTQDAAGFAQSLQRAGYATDPAYADKLTRTINTTLRLQRSLNT
ncbi:flagellar assembly peptidoglycan hydrolase FlgJ [Ideonella sp. TBM-1]|uniref:Peptidoglycan hydrolase FlgJ n=2 Tax=Ideonella livida TaxID=2707176 RepID=A0A7C9PEV5_9BURK|nr:flagellar assembly peptidoglycan hydrolase FlgJ [Ideonella livida]